MVETFTLKLLMETYNRVTQGHNFHNNAYLACASTGKAAVAIGGTTVHTAFCIPVVQRRGGLTFEALQTYRNAFAHIQIIIVDEISIIEAGLFHMINDRLKNIRMEHDSPFGNMDIIFCGDLRQLPPVNMTPIFEPIQRGIHCSALWQSLEYYPLQTVMRQSDEQFSAILTKVGNGEELSPNQRQITESRFKTRAWCEENVKTAMRLFHKNSEVDNYSRTAVLSKTYSGRKGFRVSYTLTRNKRFHQWNHMRYPPPAMWSRG